MTADLDVTEQKKRYAVPVKFFPGVMYVDRNVLSTLNVKTPSRNWTWMT